LFADFDALVSDRVAHQRRSTISLLQAVLVELTRSAADVAAPFFAEAGLPLGTVGVADARLAGVDACATHVAEAHEAGPAHVVFETVLAVTWRWHTLVVDAVPRAAVARLAASFTHVEQAAASIRAGKAGKARFTAPVAVLVDARQINTHFVAVGGRSALDVALAIVVQR
jgi:hypothetical protein